MLPYTEAVLLVRNVVVHSPPVHKLRQTQTGTGRHGYIIRKHDVNSVPVTDKKSVGGGGGV